MKSLLFPACLFIVFPALSQISVIEQEMEAKTVHNFTSFSAQPNISITEELNTQTPPAFQTHPEYGRLPYNAQCSDCYELIDKRTESSRYFAKNNTYGNTFFVQQSYGQMHYKDVNDNFITIDARLRQHPSIAGHYYAPDQPQPTLLDIGTGSTSIKLSAFDLVFNTNTKILHINGSNETLMSAAINMNNTTVGEDGALTLNAWPGINRSVTVERGSIKTNLIIPSPLSFPSAEGWLAFEDEVVLPPGYSIITVPGGNYTSEGYWQGDLKLINVSTSAELARWGTVTIFDNSQSGENISNAAYQLIVSGNTYKIRAMVKISWLNDNARVYPVTVDPLVSGSNTWTAGNIGFSPYAPGNGFCGSSSGYCLGGPLNVIFPGAATITNVLWSSRYIAVSPTAMGHGGFRMVGPCGENPTLTNNWWSCNSSFSGTCSGVNNVVPNLANCLPASCNATTVMFRTKNIHCINTVAGACNTTRLRFVNNFWSVTVQGQNLSTLSNTTTGNGTQTVNAVCYGTVTLNPNPLYSVGPYTFLWSPGGQTTQTRTFSPTAPGTTTLTCQVTDACGVVRTATFAVTNNCVLPLELSEFYLDYNGQKCNLNWTTSYEKNSEYFLIEKSSDGINYVFFDKIGAAGNSHQTRKYSIVDHDPDKNNITYYRLRQFNAGNNDPALNLVKVLDPKNTVSDYLKVQPNPASSILEIYLSESLLNRNVTLQVFDNSGKKVTSVQVNKFSSKSAYSLNIESLKNGLYSLHAFDESGHSAKINFIKN